MGIPQAEPGGSPTGGVKLALQVKLASQLFLSLHLSSPKHKLQNLPSRLSPCSNPHSITKSFTKQLEPPSPFAMVRWEDVRDDLLDAVMQVAPAFTREQQDQIVTILNERGHGVTWNAMRYAGLASPLSFLSFSIPPSHIKASAWGQRSSVLPLLLFHHPTVARSPSPSPPPPDIRVSPSSSPQPPNHDICNSRQLWSPWLPNPRRGMWTPMRLSSG